MNKQNNNKVRNSFPYLILAAVIVFVLIVLQLQGDTVKELKTGELLQELKNNNVTEISVTPNSNESVYYVEGKLKDYKEGESFKTKIVPSDVSIITEYVTMNDIAEFDTNSDPGSSTFLYILVNVLPFVLVISIKNKVARNIAHEYGISFQIVTL